QVQQNANSIQQEVEKAFQTLQREKIVLTGSSRTDAGVHALQNYFHFDFTSSLDTHFAYKMNAILPGDIVVNKLIPVSEQAHCRFDAISREYEYFIYRHKNPFLNNRAFYFPYKLNIELMHETTHIIKRYTYFTSFSKRNTQVKTFVCHIMESLWKQEGDCIVFYIKGDRFLRGMVRAMVATILRIGREKMTMKELQHIIEMRDCTGASFAVPARGLFLMRVNFPGAYFDVD